MKWKEVSFQEFCWENKYYKNGTKVPKLDHKGRFNTKQYLK